MNRQVWKLGIGAALLLIACGPREDRSDLVRRAVSPAAQNGWARLPLDAEAQRAYPELWLGDAEGNSVPFERERDGLWTPRQLELDRLLLGRDANQHPSAQFSLKFPEGWQVREREHLHLELDLVGRNPWVCRVEVARRLDGGEFLKLEQAAPMHLYDLGASGAKRELTLPWEAQDYRITLIPAQGEAPSLRGLKITATTRPEALQSDAALAPTPQLLAASTEQEGERWSLELPQIERIVGADVLLKAPVAPVQPVFRKPQEPGRERSESTYVSQGGLVWNLPALETRATRLSLGPLLTKKLELTLPVGARLDRVELLVRREVLLFPAEAGRPYFLHLGGRVKRAPGSLATLPESSRALYAKQPLGLGPAEADPQGLPRIVEAPERARPWLPWIAGLVVLVLGLGAWRMFKPAQPGAE